MSRATSLADLYRASVQEYTKSPAEWKGLLSCVARFYKRSFDNAVLIYAQKPDATQLGTFDEWHDKRVGRSINRGAKSIAVIDVAALLCCPIITLVACHRINRYNDMRTEKGKGSRTPVFREHRVLEPS